MDPFNDCITDPEKDDDKKDITEFGNTLPWIEKYRPTCLDDMLSHEEIKDALKIFIKKRCLPHLLLYGPSGSGKTSAIMACAKELYGKYYPFMVMELNASDDRGIEVVRNKIKQFVSCQSVFFGSNPNERNDIFKLVILDETDAMTDDAQAILRKVVEEYTENTRFCLICNYIQRIIPALQSRCTRFRFSPVNNIDIKSKLINVAKQEHVKITNSGIDTIIKRSHGDMRKVLNILQSTSMVYKVVNEKNVNNCSGYPQKSTINDILKLLINKPLHICYNKIRFLINDQGLSLNDIIQEVHDKILYYITDNKKSLISKYNYKQLAHILDKMRDIEFNQSINTTDDIQLGAFIGLFKIHV
jgi:replication factor C subunit 3/5